MSNTTIVALIIAVVVLLVLFILKDKVKEFFLRVNTLVGSVEAQIKTEQQRGGFRTSSHRNGSVQSGNKQFGRSNTLKSSQKESTQTDNLQLGEKNDISMGKDDDR